MRSTASWAPLRFMDRTLDGYQPTTDTARKALDACRRFAAGEISGLVLAGPTGIGKTHLAVAAAQARYNGEHDAWQVEHAAIEAANPEPEFETWNGRADRKRRISVRLSPAVPGWCSVPELIVGLRSDMDRERSERTWSEQLEALATFSGTVVLDDLGREKVSDWTGEAVYVLVNSRYERMLPTIVTTNLTGAELAASPYWPVISRLAEDGELVRIDGSDHRLTARKAKTA